MQIPRVGKKALKRAKINYNKSRNLRPKTQVATLFALWSAPNVAILFPGCHSRMQKAFSLPRSRMQIPRVGKKALKRAKINYNKSRNLRPKTQVATLFALWSAPNVAILFPGCHSRMQKAFSLPRSCMQILRVGKKALKRAKVNMTKAAAYDKSRNLRPKTQVAALFALWSAPSAAVLILRGLCARCSLHTRLPLCRRQICRSRQCSSGT